MRLTKSAQETQTAWENLKRVALLSTWDDAKALRRAALTLHRWYEHECNGTIQRDEEDGLPYQYSGVTHKRLGKCADREKGAIKAIALICKRLGLHYYLQTDPRGGTLYVDTKEIPDNNYSRSTFIA